MAILLFASSTLLANFFPTLIKKNLKTVIFHRNDNFYDFSTLRENINLINICQLQHYLFDFSTLQLLPIPMQQILNTTSLSS